MRSSVEVKRDALRKSIETCEEKSTFPTLTALYEAVAKEYNREVNPLKPITASVVALRIREWSLPFRTSPNQGKSKKVVDRDLLTKTVAEQESEHKFTTHSDLFKAVAKAYNAATNGAPITYSIVGLRIKEWAIPLKTPKGKKGKPATDIDRDLLVSIINSLEDDREFLNWQELFAAVAESYTAESGEPTSPAAIYQRAKTWGLTLKTPKGKKGNVTRKRVEVTGASLEAVRSTIPDATPLADEMLERFQNGSRAAAVELKCLQCQSWEKVAVATCDNSACPLWHFRPFQAEVAKEDAA